MKQLQEHLVEEELFELFDEENKSTGKTEKRSIVHKTGLLHRAVNVLLYNSKDQLLIQQRAASKLVCPLAWDLSVRKNNKKIKSNFFCAISNTR